MTRRKDAGDSVKFMGHGKCETLSRSCSLPVPTDSGEVIAQHCCKILQALRIQAKDIRGMGIQMTKLSDGSVNEPSLFQFVKPVSVDELYKKDKSLQVINQSEITTILSSKKSRVIENFMKQAPSIIRTSNEEEPIRELPPLPSMDVLHTSSSVTDNNAASTSDHYAIQVKVTSNHETSHPKKPKIEVEDLIGFYILIISNSTLLTLR